jgi:hypothetical protein
MDRAKKACLPHQAEAVTCGGRTGLLQCRFVALKERRNSVKVGAMMTKRTVVKKRAAPRLEIFAHIRRITQFAVTETGGGIAGVVGDGIRAPGNGPVSWKRS